MSVGLIYDERYLQHDTGPVHPERSDRLRAIHAKLSGNGLMDELAVLEPQPAAVDRITAVHGPKYVERVRETCASGLG
ncbi:MAG: histone deacetylase, partial [Desulfobacterales bacterium]|nr:histone deacetylase [Desulfobacterales bacterium]